MLECSELSLWDEFLDLRTSFRDTLGLTNGASVSGGISTCSAEELVFISDSLHDRIIITDGSGRVLDYVRHAPLLCASLFSFVWMHSSWCISIMNFTSFSPRMLFSIHQSCSPFPRILSPYLSLHFQYQVSY